MASPPNIATPSMTDAMDEMRTVRLLNKLRGKSASAPIFPSTKKKVAREASPMT